MKARIKYNTPFEELPVLLTIQEVALYTNRSQKALQNSITENKCPFSVKKIGGRYLIEKSQLSAKVEIK